MIVKCSRMIIGSSNAQARVQSLLRVVAEQGELRPSLTSLTSFSSHIDMAELYSNYHNTTTNTYTSYNNTTADRGEQPGGY